jgi:hypothetical protein
MKVEIRSNYSTKLQLTPAFYGGAGRAGFVRARRVNGVREPRVADTFDHPLYHSDLNRFSKP